jgi:hypothetical protein
MLAIKSDTTVISDKAIPTEIKTNVTFGILKIRKFSKNRNEQIQVILFMEQKSCRLYVRLASK